MIPNIEPKDNLEKMRREFSILYEVSNIMRTTLNLNQIFYIILTALTSHEGLGFNRAMLFLVNDKGDTLEGVMGIGPQSGEEADRIWRGIAAQGLTMEDIINAYDKFKSDNESKLNVLLRGIRIPLNEKMGVLALTILEGMPFEITNEEATKKVDPTIKETLKTEYFVTIPLKAKDKVLGAILVDNIFNKKPITKSDIRILTMFANHAGLAIENSRLYEQSLLMSKQDWLTKLWNSGEFHKRLSLAIEKAKINDARLSLAMIDMDNFKQYNDTHGHLRGDDALRDIAKVFAEKSRNDDIVARYGGEEFAVIMPFTSKSDAKEVAERLRSGVEKFFIEKRKDIIVTASIGIATFPEDAADKENLIACADSALYESKRNGKNKISLFRHDMRSFFEKLRGFMGTGQKPS